MTETPNYKLRRPEPTDYYDIGDHNYNADIIDAELKKHSDKHASTDEALKGIETDLGKKAPSEHSHEISDVDGLQAALNDKASKSHGTHVTYGTTAPKAAGTASAGSAETVSRSDHIHPEQTNVTGNAGSADKVDTVSVTPQESTATLYPAFVDSNNAAATPEEINTTSGLRISVLYGTVDKTGHVILALGTGVPSGTDKNVIGGLRLYTQGAGFIDLKPSEASDDNFSILLPNAEGRLALDTPASATAAGLVNTAAQTFAGAKTFNGPVYPNGATDPAVPQARKLASGTAEANDTNCPPGGWYGQHV